MRFEQRVQLGHFLTKYPGMRVQPSAGDALKLEGEFAFAADCEGGPIIEDAYLLAVNVPKPFPKVLPSVEEVGGRVPRDPEHHVNPGGSLCLGTPARLLIAVAEAPTLPGFAERCLVPFLYAMTHRFRRGGPLIFGELEHGPEGEIRDAMELLDLDSPTQAVKALKLLGMKKRKANKKPCPCGCRRRLGRCPFNKKIYELRDKVGRPQFRAIEARLRRFGH